MDSLENKKFNFPKDYFRFFDDGEPIDEVGEYEVDIAYTYILDTNDCNYRDSKRPIPPPIPGMPNAPSGMPKIPGAMVTPPNFNNPPNAPGVNMPPIGPPPYSIPAKDSKNIVKLGSSNNTNQITNNSIRPCLYKYVYIWQNNGYNYWAYLTSLTCCSVSGWRWIGFRWVYFGVDLKRISSFICF